MLLEEVDVGVEDVAEAGEDAQLGGGQEQEVGVVLQEAQALVYGVEEEGLQVVLGALWHVARQAVQPGLHEGAPAQVHRVLKKTAEPVLGASPAYYLEVTSNRGL